MALEKPRERKKQQLFLIEGKKEIEMAIQAGYRIGNIFYCPDLVGIDELGAELIDGKLVVPVSRRVFAKIAVRENSSGVVAIAEMKTHDLRQLTLSTVPLILVLESVEKPGNLGAILRTADAAGLDAVIVCDPQTDVYNPNTIRASLGCVFTQQIAITESEEAIAFLRGRDINIWSTFLEASVPYYKVDFTSPGAIVMGAEATGISEKWINGAKATIVIPMLGQADSMNVSTAAAVVIFEARRQRGFQ